MEKRRRIASVEITLKIMKIKLLLIYISGGEEKLLLIVVI